MRLLPGNCWRTFWGVSIKSPWPNRSRGSRKGKRTAADAIALDVLMENGNGFDVLTALRKDPETSDLPVIILSILDQKRVALLWALLITSLSRFAIGAS